MRERDHAAATCPARPRRLDPARAVVVRWGGDV